MSMQYMIQLCRGPTTARLCTLISFVRKSQLILQVLTNPFCQFGWQPTQDRMSSPVYVLQPLWRGKRSISRDREGAGFSANSILLGQLVKTCMYNIEHCIDMYIRCIDMYIRCTWVPRIVCMYHYGICHCVLACTTFEIGMYYAIVQESLILNT